MCVCVCVCVCVWGVGVLLHLRSQFYGGPWSYNKDLHYSKYIVRMYTSYRLNKYHQMQIYLKGYLIKRFFLVNIHFLNGETPRIQPVCEKSTIILSQKKILRLRTMFYHQDFTAPNIKLFLLPLLSLALFSASEPLNWPFCSLARQQNPDSDRLPQDPGYSQGVCWLGGKHLPGQLSISREETGQGCGGDETLLRATPVSKTHHLCSAGSFCLIFQPHCPFSCIEILQGSW